MKLLKTIIKAWGKYMLISYFAYGLSMTMLENCTVIADRAEAKARGEEVKDLSLKDGEFIIVRVFKILPKIKDQIIRIANAK